MRRFYREAAPAEVDGGFQVLLDGRPLRTPARIPLVLPSRRLTAAVAAEWNDQGEEIAPLSMPLMRLAATAVDRIAGRREPVIDEIAAFAGTDLLCYRVSEPEVLRRRQDETWQPLLDWAGHRYDVHLQVTRSILAVPQSPAACATLRAAVAALDDFALSAIHALTTGFGSLVLALAVLEREISPDAAFAASQLDESYQIERWGEDEEAMTRREALRQDMMAAARLLDLLYDS